MMSPLRGLLTNITWDAPRRTQSSSCSKKNRSGETKLGTVCETWIQKAAWGWETFPLINTWNWRFKSARVPFSLKDNTLSQGNNLSVAQSSPSELCLKFLWWFIINVWLSSFIHYLWSLHTYSICQVIGHLHNSRLSLMHDVSHLTHSPSIFQMPPCPLRSRTRPWGSRPWFSAGQWVLQVSLGRPCHLPGRGVAQTGGQGVPSGDGAPGQVIRLDILFWNDMNCENFRKQTLERGRLTVKTGELLEEEAREEQLIFLGISWKEKK